VVRIDENIGNVTVSFIISSARARSILSVGSVQYGGPGRVL